MKNRNDNNLDDCDGEYLRFRVQNIYQTKDTL